MKHVYKRTEPIEFRLWLDQANDDWRPTYDGLLNPEKTILHLALLDEQFFVCCYCGRSIEANTSHIEHFKPKKFCLLELEYSNLHASCIPQTVRGSPMHCGRAKDSWFDDQLAISPLDSGCEDRFQYTLTGSVFATATEDQAAQKMIKVLRLDDPSLEHGREDILAGVLDADFIETATVDELLALAEGFSRPDNGRLSNFGHVVASVCRGICLR